MPRRVDLSTVNAGASLARSLATSLISAADGRNSFLALLVNGGSGSLGILLSSLIDKAK